MVKYIPYITNDPERKRVHHFGLNGLEFKSCLKSNRFGMNSAPLGTMEANNDSFGVISNTEAEFIDKVMLLASDADCSYLTVDCISELSQTQPAQDDNCSVEVISDTCKVHKYYTETAETIVENHFSRSFLAQSLVQLTEPEANMNERDPIKKTGKLLLLLITYFYQGKPVRKLSCYTVINGCFGCTYMYNKIVKSQS